MKFQSSLVTVLFLNLHQFLINPSGHSKNVWSVYQELQHAPSKQPRTYPNTFYQFIQQSIYSTLMSHLYCIPTIFPANILAFILRYPTTISKFFYPKFQQVFYHVLFGSQPVFQFILVHPSHYKALYRFQILAQSYEMKCGLYNSIFFIFQCKNDISYQAV